MRGAASGSRGPIEVWVDGRVYDYQKAGGVTRYFDYVARGGEADASFYFLGVGRNHPSRPGGRGTHCWDYPFSRVRRFRPLYLQWRRDRSFARRGPRRLIHPSFYDTILPWPGRLGCPVVMTIYDFIHARYPEQAGGGERVIRLQREWIERADALICISESTRKDLARFCPGQEHKAVVIPLAIEEKARTPQPAGREFCFLGSRDGYKSFRFTLECLARVRADTPAQLVVVGAPLNATEQAWLVELGLEGSVRVLPSPPRDEVLQVLAESVALLYPSLWEGFGLPVLEAFAVGTLVLASNTSSLPEVAGDAGLLLPPRDLNAWSEAMKAVLSPDFDRGAWLERGRRQLGQFSLERLGVAHIELYSRLAGGSST